MSYCSDSTPIFGQRVPRFTCRHAARFKEISEQKGYPIKCRNWRCSLECNANAANKWSLCIERHLLKCLDDGKRVYRGCLKLAKDASPEQHRQAKETFLLAIRRWAKRHGHEVEICAKLDIVNLFDAHWDTVLWTDAPHRKLHDFFGKAWKRAGGTHQSLVKVFEEELADVADYTVKRDDLPVKPKRVIPASREEMGGLEVTWTTAGFWRGSSLDGVWSELIQEWQKARAASNLKNKQLTDTFDPDIDPEIASQLDVFIDQRYIPGQDKHCDRQAFLTRLPRTPEEGIGLAEYSQQWGVRPEYMLSILESLPMARMTNGEADKAGHCRYNGWYMATPA